MCLNVLMKVTYAPVTFYLSPRLHRTNSAYFVTKNIPNSRGINLVQRQSWDNGLNTARSCYCSNKNRAYGDLPPPPRTSTGGNTTRSRDLTLLLPPCKHWRSGYSVDSTLLSYTASHWKLCVKSAVQQWDGLTFIRRYNVTMSGTKTSVSKKF